MDILLFVDRNPLTGNEIKINNIQRMIIKGGKKLIKGKRKLKKI